jgi:hypothetical protein
MNLGVNYNVLREKFVSRTDDKGTKVGEDITQCTLYLKSLRLFDREQREGQDGVQLGSRQAYVNTAMKL